MRQNSDLGVIILGAGASRRMGRAKLLLPWGETTVIGHLIAQWRAQGAGQVAIVVRPGDEGLAAELDRRAVAAADRIPNPEPERGMYSSILCAAAWTGWRKEISRWAIVLGDQPHLRPETLQTLLEFAAQHPEAICQPVLAGKTGHPVILPRRELEAMSRSPAGTLKEFLAQAKSPCVTVSLDDPGLRLDLDTPEDYQRAVSEGRRY